jgi:hypothetical protein
MYANKQELPVFLNRASTTIGGWRGVGDQATLEAEPVNGGHAGGFTSLSHARLLEHREGLAVPARWARVGA